MIRLKLLLIAKIALLSFSMYTSQLPMATFAQQEFSNSNSTEAVTSTNDAILKSILIVSQVSVIGITFSYFFFHRISDKRTHKHKESKEEEENKDFIYGNDQYLKRFTVIISLCCIAITFTSTGIILVSAYELSRETTMDLFSTFSILYPTSIGQVWAIRIATSLLTMGLAITHYALKKRATKKKINGDNHVKNHSSKTPSPIILIPLIVIIIISSINLYSNSMISHSNALPFLSSLAISMDWIHFMAVSIWIGGLFFLSTILLKGLKSSLYNHRSGNVNTNNNDNKDEMKNSIKNTQHTLILLTYFSLIAIVSLTIIGITGMYLGLVHLQSINAIFNTAYGNILIIKLSLAFPLIFLGRYNQLKIQKYAKSSKNILIANFNNDNPNTPFIAHNENGLSFFNTVNRSIKIESIIGISVLVAASFLSVTSPPSLSVSTQDLISNGNNNNNNNAGATSTSIIASDFSALAIILSVVILVLGIINFRKNQQNIKDMSITD